MDEFIEYLHEVFAEFGQVQIKPMFGGKGVFYEGVMIGLVFDNVLYLKADKSTASKYIERGLSAFQYQKKDKKISLSFYQAPTRFPGRTLINFSPHYTNALGSSSLNQARNAV